MGQCWPGLVIHTMQTGNSLSYELLIRLFLHLESVCMCVRTVLCYHVSGNCDVHCVGMQGMKEVYMHTRYFTDEDNCVVAKTSELL